MGHGHIRRVRLHHIAIDNERIGLVQGSRTRVAATRGLQGRNLSIDRIRLRIVPNGSHGTRRHSRQDDRNLNFEGFIIKKNFDSGTAALKIFRQDPGPEIGRSACIVLIG
jgi:hypothetical protein